MHECPVASVHQQGGRRNPRRFQLDLPPAMPKNKVQFQKGRSRPQCLADFGTEAQYEQALYQARWPQASACLCCAGTSFCRLGSRRATFQCNHRERQVSLLAGTIFQTIKLPLTALFLAMHCLSQAKNGLSALALGSQLRVNNNTAWLLKHELMQAMLEHDYGYRLQGAVQVDDAYWGGELPGGKRGRGSENKTPFLVAVQVTAEGQPEVMKLSVLDGFRKLELERCVRHQLTPGSTAQSDGLACFGGGEAAECQHRPRVTGGGKAACDMPELLWVNTILGNVKRSLHGTSHAFGEVRRPLPSQVPVPLQSTLSPSGVATANGDGRCLECDRSQRAA